MKETLFNTFKNFSDPEGYACYCECDKLNRILRLLRTSFPGLWYIVHSYFFLATTTVITIIIIIINIIESYIVYN